MARKKPETAPATETTETVAETPTKRPRIVAAIFKEDAAKLVKIQSELWAKGIAKGDNKKPSAADAIRYLIERYENHNS